ncbi:MAG: phosphoketolase family protein [Candidatus Ancillula sp.]|jgi:xylulose-5-phosphate/fructose-6-phosphate phosphoketolase|nr:phosphoketolase family protein [Candidatus Ancillula sp.]
MANTSTVAWQKRPAVPIGDDTLASIEKYWRASNYISVGQIYLLSNPLMRGEFTRDDVKHRLVGHWGTTPGLNFIYAHMSRVIADRNQSGIYIIGPGHGGPGLVAASYLEDTYTETYPEMTKDEAGLAKLFRQFSFPGGIPSHVAPETPGSIHEGGELGYSLSHAYGAAFDNPNLLVTCIIGDGEAETGPLATAWHSNKFLNPKTDGVVLPILHLNGYKIANPTILARLPEDELLSLFHGYGYNPYIFTAGFDDEDHISIHRRYAELLDIVLDEIADIKARVESVDAQEAERPLWPMIILRSPKGWTCPKEIDGKQTEGSWRSHQVPLASARDTEEHFETLRGWLESYKPNELFDENGTVRPDVVSFLPKGDLRMSANPHANGGILTKDLVLPNIKDYAVPVDVRGGSVREATRVLGSYIRDVVRNNPTNFRVFGPDETASNRLQATFEVTNKVWQADYISPRVDEHLGRGGQVVDSMLSEHQQEGWLEAYNLTGRHGLFSSYEAFIHVIDSMFNQHAKWIRTSREIEWRKPVPSMNYLLSSHVWRQDHNGFSHQDPGFIDHVLNKQHEDLIQVYLPVDGNTLLATYEYTLQTRDRINVVVAGKQPAPTYLSIDEATAHFKRGVSIWDWASTNGADKGEPDVVIATAGDVPTGEALAAVDILKTEIPEIKIRFVNVINLLKIQGIRENPDGMTNEQFDAIFTPDKPIIFAYHGYPWLIHRLTYRRSGHKNIHVRGFIEKGTTTTPFDMVLLNNLDRYHLALTVLDHLPSLSAAHLDVYEKLRNARQEAKEFTLTGDDIPVVRDWVWPEARSLSNKVDIDATVLTAGDNE